MEGFLMCTGFGFEAKKGVYGIWFVDGPENCMFAHDDR